MPPNLVANVAEMLGLPPLFWGIMVLFVVGAFFLSRAYFIAQKEHDQGLAGYLKHLRQLSQVERVYRRGLLVFLRTLDGWLGEPATPIRPPKDRQRWHRWFVGNPWSGQAYDFCFRLAVLYPVLAILFFGVFTNNGALGDVTLLKPALLWVRIVMLVMLFSSLYGLFFLFRLLKNRVYRISYLAVGAVVTVSAIVIAVVIAVADVGVITVVFVFAFSAAAFAAGAVTFSAAAFAAGAVTFAAAAVAAADSPSIGIVAAAFASVFAISVLYVFLRHFSHFLKASAVVRGILWCFLFITYARVLYALGDTANQVSKMLLLFLGVLPLLNAPLDWLSLGLTRGLLRAVLWRVGSLPARLGFAIVDAVGAFGLMFGLVAVVIVVLSLLNSAAIAGGGSALVDLSSTLAAIRDNPTDTGHFWVYFLFFSTLVPTVVHLGIGLLGVLAGLCGVLGQVAATVPRVRKAGVDPIDTYLNIHAPLTVALTTAGVCLLVGMVGTHWAELLVPFVWLAEGLLSMAEGLVNMLGTAWGFSRSQ